jgi:catechol 2,3-dioxygenase-like lactoylglutathione lyase family enzyme
MNWLLLLMSVELLNDCVILPHLANWDKGVRVTRRWETEIVPGVTKAEDRSTGRGNPFLRQEWEVLPFTVADRARLNTRLAAALKSGRACAPYFGRAQYIGQVQAIPYETWGGVAQTYRVLGLVPGDRYRYTKGPWDVRFYTAGSTELTASGDFTADATTGFIEMTSLVIPGSIVPLGEPLAIGSVLGRTECLVDGQWPWGSGHFAFFIRPRPDTPTYENRDISVDVGTAGDSGYITGGITASTATAIDRTAITGYDAPSEAFYQTAKVIDDSDALLTYQWDGVFGAYQYTGLTPGQTYYYKRGPFDLGIIWYDAVGGIFNSVDSTAFVPGQTFCYVLCPQGQTPGKIRPGNTIKCTLTRLLPGVEANVRLHFAELDPSMNGSSGRRIFNVVVRGIRTITLPSVEPWQLASAAMFRASAIDLQVTPDPQGKIEIEIQPIAPYFFGSLNGVELRQYTWEIKELINGTSSEILRWQGFLKGCYRKGSAVYPVIFGKASVQNIQALTNHTGPVPIALQEPLGSGSLGQAGQCPAENCNNDPAIELGERLPEYPPVYFPGSQEWIATLSFPGQADGQVGYSALTGDPPADLAEGVLEAWSAAVWAAWQAHKSTQGIVATQEQLVWKFNHSPGLPRYNANAVFQDPPGYSQAAFPWEIWVNYTVAA